MASFSETKAMGLEFIREVHKTLVENDCHETYDEFRRVLKQFRQRQIHSSTAVATVQKLLHNHSHLLQAFKSFVPTNYAALPSETPLESKTSCVDFLNRVGTRFNGNGVYKKFLNFMDSYYKREDTVSEVSDKIIKLFGKKHQDLADEFRSFLPPESCSSFQERSIRKRKNNIPSNPNDDQEDWVPRKRRKYNIIPRNPSNVDDDHEIPPPKTPSPRRSKKKTDNEMEDSMCKVEVQINQLRTIHRNTIKILLHLHGARISSPMEHFTPLNLACIKELYGTNRRFTKMEKEMSEDPTSALHDLMDRLKKKTQKLQECRAKIREQWRNIHQSRP